MRRIPLFCGALISLMSFGMPLHAQTPEISSVLKGDALPLSIKLKDLTPDWRIVALESGLSENPVTSQALFGSADLDYVYFTQGAKMTVGGDSYLIAYQLPRSSDSLVAMLTPNPNAAPKALSPETVLRLSLINTSINPGFRDIRGFDLKQLLADNQKQRRVYEATSGYDVNVTTTGATGMSTPAMPEDSRLKKLGIAVNRYVHDHQGHLPSLKNAAIAMKALSHYTDSKQIFTQVDAKIPYVPNSALSRKKLLDIRTPNRMIVYYGQKPDPCGCHHALFADGSAHEILPKDWAKAKAISKLP